MSPALQPRGREPAGAHPAATAAGCPVRWRATLRSIGRQPRRTASTAAGVALALILVLVSWSMIDTVNGLLARQFGEAQRWGASVLLDQLATEWELDGLQSSPGSAPPSR